MNIRVIGRKLKDAYLEITAHLQLTHQRILDGIENYRDKVRVEVKTFSSAVYWVAVVLSGIAAIYLLFARSTVLALTFLTVPPIVAILRERMGEKAKVFWVVVSFLLIVGVYRGLRKDQEEQQSAQKELQRSFQTIGNQIGEATTKLGQIAEMEHDNLNTIVSGLQDTVNVVTGGDSFCYLDFDPALNNAAVTTAIRVGKYPLRDLSVLINDRAKADAAVRELAKNHQPSTDEIFVAMNGTMLREVLPDFYTPSRYVGGYQLTPNEKQSFEMMFRAFNGTWIERLEMRRVGDKWTKAIMVETGHRERPYFFKIDKNYPRIDGHIDVPYWPKPVKGKPEWER